MSSEEEEELDDFELQRKRNPKPKEEDEEELDEFELQLKLEEKERRLQQEGSALPKGLTYTDDDGTVMEWDAERKAYFPKIDTDFIAQYQMNYGAASTGDSGQTEWDQLSEEEKAKRYEEYWASYYQAYSKEQPKLPKFDVEGNEIEDSDDEEDGKKEAKAKKSSKTKENTTDDKEQKGEDKQGSDENKQEFDPTSDESYQYNLYYYGQEYADEYKQYYIDHPEEAAMPDWISERNKAAEEAKDLKKEEKKKKKQEKAEKRKEPPREEGWFEVDQDKCTQVYVSGLPCEFTEEEFNELMSKCGLIMFDPHTKKPKLKMYKDNEGNFKGDGLCTYIKPESVDLALNVLDDSDVKGHRMKVEKATFQLKGEYDPKKKKKKLSNKAKNKLKERQQKLFDWRPDKDPFSAERPKHERIVVLKNMFDVAEFEKEPTLINELRIDVREECSKFGEVKKVTLYDRNPEGVITVMFKEHDEADKCIAALNLRWFGGKQVKAACHDGKTKYEVEETEEEKAKRLADWNAYLAGEEKAAKEKTSVDSTTDSVGVKNVKDSEDQISENKDTGSVISNSEKGGGGKKSGVLVEDVGEEEGVV